MFWLINCKSGLALLKGHLNALFIQNFHDFVEFIALEASFKPNLHVPEWFIKLDLFTEERNNLFQAFCSDDSAFCALQPSSSLFYALIGSFFDGCRIKLDLIVYAFFLVRIDVVFNAHSFDFDLLYLQLEISLLGMSGLDVIVDACVFCDLFVQWVFWPVCEITVLLLICWCSIHVALEFVVSWRWSLIDIFCWISTLFFRLHLLSRFLRPCRSVEIGSWLIFEGEGSELNVQFSFFFLKFLYFLLDFWYFVVELLAALKHIAILSVCQCWSFERIDLAPRSRALEIREIFIEIGRRSGQFLFFFEGSGNWVILIVCLNAVNGIISISVFII